jgi:hypothetical protein
MNILVMQMPIKPLSVNAKFEQHWKTKRIIKSTRAHKFEKSVKAYLEDYREKMRSFSLNYSRAYCGLQLEVVMYVPEAEFFTKEGLISATCIDAGNALKMLEDIIYKELGINDGMNLRVSSEKRPYEGSEWLTLITVQEVPIPKSCYLDNQLLKH